MVKKIKHVTLNRRTPHPLCSSPFQGDSWMVATNDDPTIGTQENPYTLEELNSLVLIGEWPGGWVEFFGFVPWNLEDWKHILRSYQPFNDYEESIWEQNH